MTDPTIPSGLDPEDPENYLCENCGQTSDSTEVDYCDNCHQPLAEDCL